MTSENVSAETQTSSAPEVSTSVEETVSGSSSGETTEVQESQPQVEGEGQPVVAAPTYTPNFKFKYGFEENGIVSQKEAEIDPMFRALIKDAESEKKIKEIFEKAYGIDVVKNHLSREKQNRTQIESKYTGIDKSLKQLSRFVQSDDFDSFFQATNIPAEKIFKWVQKKLNEEALPQEQRVELERQKEIQRKAYLLEQQNEGYLQAYQETMDMQRQTQLQTALSRPDVVQVSQIYDEKVGEPGAFQQMVIDRGLHVWRTQGRDISADEALQWVMSRVGQFVGGPAAVGQQTMPQVHPAGQNQAARKPPVIPAVSGGATSPVRKAPRSLEELKKISDQL